MQREVEQHEVKAQTKLLSGYTVLLAAGAGGEVFVDDWRHLVTRLGADVCTKVGARGQMDRSMKKVDIVVADK